MTEEERMESIEFQKQLLMFQRQTDSYVGGDYQGLGDPNNRRASLRKEVVSVLKGQAMQAHKIGSLQAQSNLMLD